MSGPLLALGIETTLFGRAIRSEPPICCMQKMNRVLSAVKFFIKWSVFFVATKHE